MLQPSGISLQMKHKHHIIPRHAGGSDDSSNLVELTIEDHAEAHRLLYIEHGRWEDRLAWLGLSGQIGKEEILSEIYKQNGLKLSEFSKNNPRTGILNGNFGRKGQTGGSFNLGNRSFFNGIDYKMFKEEPNNKSWVKCGPVKNFSEEGLKIKRKHGSKIGELAVVTGQLASVRHLAVEAAAKKHRKAVLQFDLNGNFIQEFESATQAMKLLGFGQGIKACASGNQHTAYGFKFKYKEST